MRYVKLIDADTVLHEQRKLIQRESLHLNANKAGMSQFANNLPMWLRVCGP